MNGPYPVRPKATGQIRLTLSRRQAAALYVAAAHAAQGNERPLDATVCLNVRDALQRMDPVLSKAGLDFRLAGDGRAVARKAQRQA